MDTPTHLIVNILGTGLQMWDIYNISNFSNGCFDGSSNATNTNALSHLSTFVVQALRCIILVCLLVASAARYSSVKVMESSVFNIGTCSVFWAAGFGIAALKTVEIILLLCLMRLRDAVIAGFAVVTATQCLVVTIMLMALDHEWTYRSTAFDSTFGFTGLCCDSVRCKRNLLCRIFFVLVATALPCALVAAVEVVPNISEALFTLFLASLFLPRLIFVVMAVLVVLGREDLKPTLSAKVFLLCGVACSLGEDIPYFLLTTSDLCLRYASVYDLLQLLGVVSMVLLLLFVRSQYLRVKEECKLAMVWSVQNKIAMTRESYQQIP